MADNGRTSERVSPEQSAEGYEVSVRVCERLEREPGDLRGKYVGIVRGQIIVAHDDFDTVIATLQRVEPDRDLHFVVLAGTVQPTVIYNFWGDEEAVLGVRTGESGHYPHISPGTTPSRWFAWQNGIQVSRG